MSTQTMQELINTEVQTEAGRSDQYVKIIYHLKTSLYLKGTLYFLDNNDNKTIN